MRRAIPAELEAICLKCLEKNPARRYGCAEDLANDLGRFLSGQPTVARPRRWPTRVWRKVSKNGRVAAGMAVTAVLLVSAFLLAWRFSPGPDPLAPRRGIQSILTAGEPAELLNKESGRPLAPEWKGTPATLGDAPNEDGATVFQTQDYTALELISDPCHDRYRLTADVRHLQGVDGVGLFLWRQSGSADGMTWLRYIAFSYSDFPAPISAKDKVGRSFQCNDVLLLYDARGRPNVYVENIFREEYTSFDDRCGEAWKQIVLTVGPDGGQARLKCDTGTIRERSWTAESFNKVIDSNNRRARRKLEKDFPGEAAEKFKKLGLPTVWRPRSPLGVCATKSIISVRRVLLALQRD